jgi:hypothetical protein
VRPQRKAKITLRQGARVGGEKLAEWEIKAPRERGWRKRPGPQRFDAGRG